MTLTDAMLYESNNEEICQDGGFHLDNMRGDCCMSAVVVLGTQWGDEGKGKIVDYLAQKAETVVRYQGGSNAGHTVAVDGVEYKLRLMPSGILYKGTLCVVGNGVPLTQRLCCRKWTA